MSEWSKLKCATKDPNHVLALFNKYRQIHKVSRDEYTFEHAPGPNGLGWVCTLSVEEGGDFEGDVQRNKKQAQAFAAICWMRAVGVDVESLMLPAEDESEELRDVEPAAANGNGDSDVQEWIERVSAKKSKKKGKGKGKGKDKGKDKVDAEAGSSEEGSPPDAEEVDDTGRNFVAKITNRNGKPESCAVRFRGVFIRCNMAEIGKHRRQAGLQPIENLASLQTILETHLGSAYDEITNTHNL